MHGDQVAGERPNDLWIAADSFDGPGVQNSAVFPPDQFNQDLLDVPIWIRFRGHVVRKRFRDDTADIPIANRAFRLRALGRMAERAESVKNLALAAQLLEQAAKETGGTYTNKQQVDLSSTDGTMTPAKDRPIDAELVKALVDKLVD